MDIRNLLLCCLLSFVMICGLVMRALVCLALPIVLTRFGRVEKRIRGRTRGSDLQPTVDISLQSFRPRSSQDLSLVNISPVSPESEKWPPPLRLRQWNWPRCAHPSPSLSRDHLTIPSADGQARLPDRPREAIPEEVGRRKGLPRRRAHPRSAGWTIPRRDPGEIPQVVRELPIPLHEWLSSFGTCVYDLQDRVWCGLSETVGQEGVVPPRIPLHRYANQGSHLPTTSRVFCHSLYASRNCEYRPLPIKSSAKWKCLERTLKVSARKKTIRQPLLPQKAPPWARQPKGSCKPSRPATHTSFRSWNPSEYRDRRSRSSPTRIIGWSTSHQSPS